MDDSRATTRYAFRATSATNASSTNTNMNSSGGTAGRSQFHGMDLHTTTPSSHRRAMYISPVPLQSHPVQASPRPTTTMTSGEQTNARQRAEAAAMSARNQVLHRRLSERKRFDSADYAMKMVRRAMQSDTKDDDDMTGEEMPPIATPPPSNGAMTDAVQSPRLSPTHGRLVFAHALGTQDLDCEMKDVSNNQLGSPSPQSTTTPAMRGYGNLQSTKAASAAMSARNLLIQKKLQEKRHFDSADYQLARLGVKTNVPMDEVGKPALDRTALPFARSSSPVTLPMECDVSSPVNSPPATRAAAVRSNQMSPSVRASSGATAFGGRGDASKYGNLGVRAAKTPNDLRRDILLRQQENFIAAQNPVTSTQSSPPVESPSSSAPAPSSNQKYGKLIAANILFRKNLKDRQHFDSADYQMEAAAKQAERSGENDNNATSQPSSSTSNQDDEPHSPVLKPQAKHPKLSDDVATRNRTGGPQQTQQPVAGRGWAAHPAATMARQPLAQGREDNARMAARNVLLSRKLSEGKKRFDSGEYFVAKAEEARAAANRGQV